MKTPLWLVALGLTGLAAPVLAIDFTPRIAESIEDGVPMRRLYFSDNAQHIFYRPLPNWTRYGDAQSATFRPKDSNGEVTIQNAAAGNASIAFDAHGLETLREIARASLPADGDQPTELWEVTNPVVLQGWTSFEIGFDYVKSGQHSCRSILFINLDAKRQILFSVDAPVALFPPLYQGAYRTLASWYQPTVAGAR